MDFKINVLVQEVDCSEPNFADIPSLKFGSLPNGQAVFDSTQYYIENDLEQIDYKVFSRMCKPFINTLVTRIEVPAGELFYQNTDGHILMHEILSIIFMQFANPDTFIYFMQMMLNILENGIAFSDGFIASLASMRVPSEILQDIIDQRNGEQGEGETGEQV